MDSEYLANLPTSFSKLPPAVAMTIGNMTANQRNTFNHEYRRRQKNKTVMVLLSILFPIQFFFLDKTVLGIAFWAATWFIAVSIVLLMGPLKWIVSLLLTPVLILFIASSWTVAPLIWIVSLFLTPSWVDRHNHQQANDIIRSIRYTATQ